MGNQNNINKSDNKKDEAKLILNNIIDIPKKKGFRRNKINYKLIFWLILIIMLVILFISFLIIYFYNQEYIIKHNTLNLYYN